MGANQSLSRLFSRRCIRAQLFPALLGLGLVLAIIGAPVVDAAPQPDPVSRRWQLNIKPGPVRVAIMDVQGVGRRAFFYFTYTVKNNTGKDLLFAPSFELATDDGSISRAGAGVPASVTKALLGRLRNLFLRDQIGAVGQLLQGEENAREGLVVWPAENLEVDQVIVFAVGFSGETKTITRPDTGQPVLLRKTLMLVHDTPGDLAYLGDRPLSRSEQRWIMR